MKGYVEANERKEGWIAELAAKICRQELAGKKCAFLFPQDHPSMVRLGLCLSEWWTAFVKKGQAIRPATSRQAHDFQIYCE